MQKTAYWHRFAWLRHRSVIKTLLVMKLTMVLLTAVLFQVHATGVSQTITFSGKEVAIKKVFAVIKEQTGYAVLYNESILAKLPPATCSVSNMPLRDFLTLMLKDLPISFRIEDKTIFLSRKPASDIALQPTVPFFDFIPITGIVRGIDGQPLSGANVAVKGTKAGTTTDAAGKFTINVETGTTLIISSIGYQSQEIEALGSPLEVYLNRMISPLDETVIIGYGQTTRRFQTGSISTIKSEAIEKQPVTNVLSALAGRLPGVFVQTTNGAPGGAINIQIRGRQSIAAGTAPLYVVDGVPFTSTSLTQGDASGLQFINGPSSPLNSLIPADIESIDILKDADATAIYGARGANGVVLITTKKGKPGNMTIDALVYQGISRVARLASLLDLKDYLTIRREGYVNAGVSPSASSSSTYYAPDLTVWDTTKSTNWQKYLYGGSAPTTDANVNLSGGSTNTHFLFGMNYHDEGTIMPGDQNYQRIGGHISVEQTSTDKKFYGLVEINYSTDNNKLLRNANGSTGIMLLPPDYPIYNKDGSLNWTSTNNPVAILNQKANSKTNNLITNGVFRYTFLPGLNLKVNAGYNKIEMNTISTLPASSQNPNGFFAPTSSATFGSNYTESYLVEPQLEYQKAIGKNDFNILVGSTYQNSQTKGSSQFGTNYASEKFIENLGFAGTITGSNSYTGYKYSSIFGRISYKYSNKYLLNVNFRRDGSSRFGPGNQFGNFGAIGAGWIFSEENFFKDKTPFLSFGKIRASYGIVGNDQIPDYQYISYYSTGGTYQGVTTLNPTIISNSKYSWESTRKLEAGFELGFIKDRILFTASYYYDRSGNQLVAYPIPYISGPFGTYQANLPALVQNAGLELSLNSYNIKTKNFSWNTAFNITIPKNKLISFPGLATSSYANTYTVGEDLSNIKGYRFTGVNAQTGVSQFLDANNDSKISFPGDYLPQGKVSPDFYGGLGNTVSYQRFQIDVFFQFVKQNAQTAFLNYVPGTPIQNYYTSALSRWQRLGNVTNVQLPYAVSGTTSTARSNLNNSNASIVDASYIRLKNLSISYNIPPIILSRLHIQQFKLFVEVQNLFTFSPIKTSDPEVINSTNTFPMLKTFVMGLKLTL